MLEPGERYVCLYIKANGIQCGSPAWGRRRFCYFHTKHHDRAQRSAKAAEPERNLPPLEDANAIQIALMQTIDDVLHDRLERKQAGLVLYALQTASANLRRTNFGPSSLWDQK